LTCDALEWIASSGGGTIVEADGKISVNNPKAIKAIERAGKWVGTIAPPGVTGFAEEESRGVWQAGNAAFMRNWPYAWSLGNADDSPIKGKFEMTLIPGEEAGQTAATLGGLQLAVSKYSKNPAIAADVALYFAGRDFQKAQLIRTTTPPSIIDLYTDPDVLKVLPFAATLKDVLLKAVARPSSGTAPHYSETSRLFFNAVHDVLMQKKDAKTALADLEADLKQLLE
jgi:trehalose/maltose transport system substrate-binding protein